jgi:hypothetical protein
VGVAVAFRLDGQAKDQQQPWVAASQLEGISGADDGGDVATGDLAVTVLDEQPLESGTVPGEEAIQRLAVLAAPAAIGRRYPADAACGGNVGALPRGGRAWTGEARSPSESSRRRDPPNRTGLLHVLLPSSGSGSSNRHARPGRPLRHPTTVTTVGTAGLGRC